MLNRILLILLMSHAQVSFAFLPNLTTLPEQSKFGHFDPSYLQKFFNEFTEAKPDLAREARLISEIEEMIMDGDIEYLPIANNSEVFSIYMETESRKPKGGAILLHSRGYHANWENVIHPLRIGLAREGWNTLSVQMPVLEKNAKYYDYVPIFPYAHDRIEAAISFYKRRGIDNIILIGHGCGVHMSMSYIDKYGDSKISAYVGIGMGATDYRQKLVKQFPLDKMIIPVLDVIGEQDFSGVIRHAKYRKELMDIAGNVNNSQIVIERADHYYKNGDTIQKLIKAIDTWLSNLR